MKNGLFQKILPHLVAVITFLLMAVIFCSPALSGQVINQLDVVHWKGMAQSLFEYKEKYGHFPLWTNSMFGGMPAYQIAIEGRNKITPGVLHPLFMLFLPKPISFFFLICTSFYFLCQVLRINPWISILGAIAYGYASYNAIIVAVGHDTKMLSMCYVPALLGSLILLYEKKYWLGGALTALFSFLLVAMNHLQITYYFLIIAAFMTIAYLYHWIKNGEYKHIALALGIAIVTGVLGVFGNATNIFVTYDYSKATMRNGTLSLDTAQNAQTKKAGLPIDYAFGWSYGKGETLTLLFPGIYGGSNSGELKEGSHIGEALAEKGVPEEQAEQFAQQMPYTYWGPQPGTSGPVYLGAIVCFLFIFGMVYLKTWHKWWLLAVSILAILMSWGKNFEAFNTFLFNYLPLYNKFRAPSMILVIPQLCFAIVSVMTLQRLFFAGDKKEEKWKSFKTALYITGGLLFLGVLLYFGLDYKGENDAAIKQSFSQSFQNEQAGTDIYKALREDRQSLYGRDLIRSIMLIALAAGIIWLYLRNKMKFGYAIAGLLILNLFDLFGVGKRYLNKENFTDPDQYDAVFAPTQADLQIKKDNGYYRVLNLTQDVFNDAITSYHHNSVGGYHPAKLSITEDLLNYQLRNKQPMNLAVLNMLNTKYVIVGNQQNGQPTVQQNPDALGHAWFVKTIRYEPDAMSVMKALDNFNPRDTAILFSADKNLINAAPATDSIGTIQLISNTNDDAVYQSNSSANGLAVFSEIFYDRGWKAYIDGKESPIIRTNYVLRGLSIPAGRHEIKFSFRPASYYTGERIAMIANILI
ncbi:MAG: YfhO family protein, partial [Bacteroidota bacterium]|nr:YfhO family protein [Bacteroidota bacterium]